MNEKFRKVFHRRRPVGTSSIDEDHSKTYRQKKSSQEGFYKKNFKQASYNGRQIRKSFVVENFSEFRLHRGRCLRKFVAEQDLSANSLQKIISQKNLQSCKYERSPLRRPSLGRYQSEGILQKKILRRYSIEEDLSEDQKQKKTFQMVFKWKIPIRWSSMGEDLSHGLLWKNTSQMVFCGSSPVPCVSQRRRHF